jgi:hypothetical protein
LEARLFVDIEASGCPNACRHCSVDGRPPYGDFYSLDELRELARQWGSLIYLHEPTAHPLFPELFERTLTGDEYKSGWLPTCGFGIAKRRDYATVLKRLGELGIGSLSFTFHGLRDHHDWFAGRRGAFDDIIVATHRALEAGFSIQWQIYVDRPGLDDVVPFVSFALSEIGKQPVIGIPYHRVGARLWRYEKLRATLGDIRALKLHKLLDDVKDNRLAEPERLTAAAWLSKWRHSPSADEFFNPFEPRSWPPKPPFEWLAIHIRRDRSVFFDPMCTPPIRLGHLGEGRDVLLHRLATTPAPGYVALDPEKVELSASEQEELHPTGFSLRNKVIAKRIRTAGVIHR